MVFCLGTDGSKSSLLRNGWFQCFTVYELNVSMVNNLEMGGSNDFRLETEGSNGSLFRNRCFMVFCYGTEGSLLRNGWFQCFPV